MWIQPEKNFNFVLQSIALPRKVCAMPNHSEAEEHLRVIRSLMEKATIYRAISAEAAAVGGALAIAASFALGNWWPTQTVTTPLVPISERTFVSIWLGILVMTAGANILFLWQGAKRRNDQFVSAGMKAALRAILPPYFVAAYITALAFIFQDLTILVPAWLICHGLALLATAHFSPRSLSILGWLFLLTGLLCVFGIHSTDTQVLQGSLTPGERDIWLSNQIVLNAQRWMAATFGLFHLIYAACTWPRKTATSDSASEG